MNEIMGASNGYIMFDVFCCILAMRIDLLDN